MIDTFLNERRIITLASLRYKREVYELISLRPGRVHNLGHLTGYGTVVMTLHRKQTVPTNPSSTQGQSGTHISSDIQLKNSTGIIDIPNFAALLNQV